MGYQKNRRNFEVDISDRASIPCFAKAANTPESDAPSFELITLDGKVTLNQTDTTPNRQLQVDFATSSIQQRLQTFGKKHPLAKAIGLHKLKAADPKPLIVDATAGLGRDSLMLAWLGCKMILIEQQPLLHALLADGLKRAFEHTKFAPLQPRMLLHHADSKTLLAEWAASPETQPDMVYLDPMFPIRQKSALVKKEMQMLQALVGKGICIEEEQALLDAALQSCKRKVVVKRPKEAPPLGGEDAMQPDYAVGSPSMRYDVYFVSSALSLKGEGLGRG